MNRERELKIIRRAYAKQVTAAAGVGDPQVEAAFAAVAREDFLGPGPWHIVRWGGGYRATPDADPIYLYTDDVIGILPKRNLNNGQPSLDAALIAAAAPQPGEHVLHIGAGVGYYTAILAELVGVAGRVRRSKTMPSSPPARRRIRRRRRMSAWCTATAREPRSNRPTSSMSMPARRGPQMHGSTV
jgi:protein-L-isoaspartate O-methyltransferase